MSAYIKGAQTISQPLFLFLLPPVPRHVLLQSRPPGANHAFSQRAPAPPRMRPRDLSATALSPPHPRLRAPRRVTSTSVATHAPSGAAPLPSILVSTSPSVPGRPFFPRAAPHATTFRINATPFADQMVLMLHMITSTTRNPSSAPQYLGTLPSRLKLVVADLSSNAALRPLSFW
ncbi:hypothetical protein GGX14DRAFT_576180 [Mycena pura]|uniref:Uncharacterized protein n=1 Tax=Mycena pura TaxID=153505 RepID=A0AAD6UUM5_9AGAR|nr:hypothetical protein GGX14DRAFT_576180 [Mycena pura]